jgi:hypothetical protein
MAIDLCPHKANPKACPTCYRLKPPPPKPQISNIPVIPGVPMGQVMPMSDAIQRAMQQRASQTPVQVANGKQMKEPFHSGNAAPPPEPPQRPQLIDWQPVHPNLDKSKASFR